MNKTEKISDKTSRSIWFWSVGFLTSLFLLSAIAMPLGQNHRAIKHVEALGGEVETKPNSMFEALPASWQKWLRSSLGERIKSIETVKEISYSYGSSISDEELVSLKRFTNLEALNFSHTPIKFRSFDRFDLYVHSPQISDVGLSHLKGLTNLTSLVISNTQITDAGLIHLKGLTKLESLFISNTKITDVGLSHLKGITNLKYLDISGTQISNAGLIHLKGLTKLTHLILEKTQVSKMGVVQLQTALPDCSIIQPYAPQ